MSLYKTYVLIGLLTALAGCSKTKSDGTFHFTLLDAADTHIDFNNQITESDSVNVYDNEYMYNGSGVGIGDFNNDGLADVFFAGSMVSCRLYINKGNFSFEDVTEKAGVETQQWCTGVSIVDINNDGFQDVYVCSSHSRDPAKRTNRLFINDGKMHFSEQAAAYGLADTGCATQAVFFDYDKDGDLDMYLLNHRLYSNTNNNLSQKDTSGNSPAEDRLYRNDGIVDGHPFYREVTKEAGIKEDGYGLGIVVTDVNNDNWPDLYVANDYIGNDLLWINNKNGTFSNCIKTALRHQSYNSMGVDAADINNDGLADIAVLDMLPETNERKKMMFSAMGQEKYDMQQRLGYEPEFVRNMLQLNNGLRTIDGRREPFYSEIGQLAGIEQTDWSWSVLLADFDNDGNKDMHITNGLAKDVTNNDYATFKNAQTEKSYAFGNTATKGLDKSMIAILRENLDEYGSIKASNYLFHNDGDLTFSNMTGEAGLDVPSISNGAAYADLDNDGDLDLVVNNMNQEAFVYRNDLRKTAKDTAHNFLTLHLEGSTGNGAAVGAKLTIFSSGKMQFAEQSPVRGFKSSVDQNLHFGLGSQTYIDTLKVIWPNDKMQVLTQVRTNQFLTLKQADAQVPIETLATTTNTYFTAANTLNTGFKHIKSQYYDYGSQRGLPQKYSQLGPCIATGDMNGDGLEDFFVGGAAYQSGRLFFQTTTGSFTATDLVQGMKPEEDLAAQLFDADGDGDLDLLVTGGSTEFGLHSPNNNLRLYTNNGKGRFMLNTTALPVLSAIAQAVAVFDFDGDGDLDVFIGGRVEPQQYPQNPRSYLLQNNHGVFADATAKLGRDLQYAGMLTAAVATDFNSDGQPDLIVCGEWMPLRFFVNHKGNFTEVTAQTGLAQTHGMWRSLQLADLDNDGDMDIVAGNMGLNNKYHPTPNTPMMLYAKDIDNNGTKELIPAYYVKNNDARLVLFPALDRTQLADESPAIKKKYLLHKDFAAVDMQKLTDDYGTEGWTKLSCDNMQSEWIENLGKGKFAAHVLPLAAQVAPVNSIVAADLDNDGNIDLVLAGNEYETEVMTGRYDASYGLILKGNGKGSFVPVNIAQSGFIVDGDVKSLKMINLKQKGKLLIAAINNDSLRTYLQSDHSIKKEIYAQQLK